MSHRVVDAKGADLMRRDAIVPVKRFTEVESWKDLNPPLT